MRYTRRFKKKQGTRKRQRGGFMTPEEYHIWQQKTLKELNTFLKNNTRFTDLSIYRDEVLTMNDGDYLKFKYTYLQPGQLFTFRSKTQLHELEYTKDKYTWADYTASLGKPSFLTTPSIDSNDDEIQQLYVVSEKLTKYFGEWLNFIEIKKPIKILHFPVNYDEDTLGLRSYTSNKEGIVKKVCARRQLDRCVNGYTMDFLWRITRERTGLLKGINLQGYRELAIHMNDPDTVGFVGSVHAPVGMTLEEAKAQLVDSTS